MIRQDWSTLKKLMFMKAAAGGGSAAVERTATGNPLTFITDLARQLKSLLIPFTPQQEGTGDPSPENIRSILPWNGLKVFGGGKNYASDISNRGNMQNSNGVWSNSNTDSKTYFHAVIQFFNGSTYIKNSVDKTINQSGMQSMTFNVDVPNCNLIVLKHSGSQRDLSLQFPFSGEQGEYTILFNVLSANPSEVGGLKISTIEMVKGTPTETDIPFASPVYGGTLDVVSGVLTVEWGARIETGQSPNSWSSTDTATQKRFVLNKGAFDRLPKVNSKLFANYFKNSTSPASWNAFFGSTSNFLCFVPLDDFQTKDSWLDYLAQNPLTIVYELDEPYEVQLTGEQITALVGNNTIWSDADGSMTCVYLVSSKYADEHPVGGLSSGLGSGLLGSNPDQDEPIEDPEENPEE